jgi:hypothetical protein
VYSKGTKKGRGVQEKGERVSITIYLDKKVWNDFQKSIAPSGISGGKIWGQIFTGCCPNRPHPSFMTPHSLIRPLITHSPWNQQLTHFTEKCKFALESVASKIQKKRCHMKKVTVYSVALVFLIASLCFERNATANPLPDDKILIDSGVYSWVPNPLVGSHNWKKVFSDDKYSSSQKAESLWYYDSKTTLKATDEKLNFKGQAFGLEGATLAWVKVVELKTNRIKYLYYALWPEKRVALFFGIFEKEDGPKYVEDVGEEEDIQRLAPGLMREALESLFNALFKSWWKVWQ